MAGERHLVARAEDAQPVVGGGRGGGEDEGGFGQARPARDGLHRVVVEALRVEHDRERVAGAGAVGEDVELGGGAGHGETWGEEGERAASVGGRWRAGDRKG